MALQKYNKTTEPSTDGVVYEFASDVVREISIMASERVGGTVIFNCKRRPWEDLVLADISRYSQREMEPFKYEFGILQQLFDTSRKGHDGAVIITVFDELGERFVPMMNSTKNLLPTDSNCRTQEDNEINEKGVRHLSALRTSELTDALIVVVSEESGRITCVRRKSAECNVTGQFVEDKLNALIFEEMQTESGHIAQDRMREDDKPLTIAEQLITKNCKVTLFNAKALRDEEWYYFCYEATHMQLHQCFSRVAFRKELRLPQNQQTTTEENQVVRPSDDEVKRWVRRNAENWLVALQQNEDALSQNPFDQQQSRMFCYVLEYGGKRLGGIFLTLNLQRRTILFGHPFVNRDLLHNRYLLRFLGALMKYCFYTPLVDTMEFFVPPRLLSAFRPLLEEVRAKESDELFAHYSPRLYNPNFVTGFTFKITDLPGMIPICDEKYLR